MIRHVLLVEDVEYQFRSLADELRTEGWEVIHANDKEDALYRLRVLKEENTKLDVAAIDLGLPPAKDDPMKIGLQLINELRQHKEYCDLPVLAYTALVRFDYATVLRQLLVHRASFIYLRPMGQDVRFVDILNYVRLGFVLLSPTPAEYLPSAVPSEPDPLDEKLWETLGELNKGLSQSQAANELNISSETVKSRVDKVKQILTDLDAIPADARSDELLAWYREHKARYARE